MSKNPNYAEKLEQLQDLEGSTHSQHLLVEVVIMCILCVVGWVLLGFWQLVVWFCITYFLMSSGISLAARWEALSLCSFDLRNLRDPEYFPCPNNVMATNTVFSSSQCHCSFSYLIEFFLEWCQSRRSGACNAHCNICDILCFEFPY